MHRWLVVLLAMWIASRINHRQERLWAGNLLSMQRASWQLTAAGVPLAPELPARNRHVLEARG